MTRGFYEAIAKGTEHEQAKATRSGRTWPEDETGWRAFFAPPVRRLPACARRVKGFFCVDELNKKQALWTGDVLEANAPTEEVTSSLASTGSDVDTRHH